MRSFKDKQDREWEVALGKESYGTLVLLFSRRGSPEVRRSTLNANTRLEAEVEFHGLSRAALQRHLERSEPWA